MPCFFVPLSHGWPRILAIIYTTLFFPVFAAASEDLSLVLKEVRANCQKFPLLPLKIDATGKAPMEYLKPAEDFFISNGYRYTGFRFRAPADITGDFSWMFLMRNQDAPMSLNFMQWDILARDEDKSGFITFENIPVGLYPELKAKFPNTRSLTLQQQPRSFFSPKKEYVIWFRFSTNQKPPEYAVAISFMGQNQKYPESKLPLGKPKPGPPTPTSYEGDPW